MSKSDFFNHYQMMYRLYTNPLDIPFYIEKSKNLYKKRSVKSRKSILKKAYNKRGY